MKLLSPSLLFCSSLLACKKDSPSPAHLFELVPKQPATLAIGGAVRATLTELNDSRCPSDVVCIWGGTIAATVELTDGNATQTVRLGYQKPYSVDSAAVVLASQSYWLRLLDAKPYPSTKNGSLPRSAFFRLRPR